MEIMEKDAFTAYFDDEMMSVTLSNSNIDRLKPGCDDSSPLHISCMVC